MRLPSPSRVFVAASPEQWLRQVIPAGPRPRNLFDRNMMQMMLAERYTRHFGGTTLDALAKVAAIYGETFPH